MNNVEKCKNDLRKFYYLPPFNESCNTVAGDGFFYANLYRTYPIDIRLQALDELKPEMIAAGYLPMPGGVEKEQRKAGLLVNEKSEKKLVCAVYNKNKIGIAYNHGPAFLFVRSVGGELDAFEKQLVANMVYAYNQNKEITK